MVYFLYTAHEIILFRVSNNVNVILNFKNKIMLNNYFNELQSKYLIMLDENMEWN